ncbi:carbamoyltransferase family protein [Sphingobacterium bambusae]|uniref:Carbamoyltransferase n=1 Tax=Sphingobacterium bambusae TaxID=662858 RepID=A0ABW6BH26_9SPHI|nr:carbamoyltransferase [Sphingobacterium bambusae]WPL49366.1 carbamoyltransferase [Sphingobacterium bambusae]
MSIILGISAFYHDSAACLLVDGKIIASVEEERFNRVKHSAEFPIQAIRYCLGVMNLCIDDLDAVVFYEKPFLKFERLLQTYYSFAPKGLISFLKAIPIWLDEKLFIKQKIKDGLSEIGPYNRKTLKLLFSEHHLSHAASAFYPSKFTEAAILTVDGVGEWATASIAHAQDEQITIVKEMAFPHSVGLLYSAFTYYLGFTVNSGEYKVMGLAPFGDKTSDETLTYIEKIKSQLVTIHEDGSIRLNQAYFGYATGLKMANEKKWEHLFGIPKRKRESELYQHHCNLALAAQLVLEEIVLKMAREAKRVTNSSNLCLAGGVALNCVANTKIREAGIFDNIFVQPAAGDAGGAIGAAFAVYHLYYGHKRTIEEKQHHVYLGPEIDEKDIINLNRRFNTNYSKFDSYRDLSRIVAKLICEGNVIGWFQGRMEIGPRALGNRSILADPTNPKIQELINTKIKRRESFRPFAPVITLKQAKEYFDIVGDSPYMLYTAKIKERYRKPLAENFSKLTISEKLAFIKSDFPAVTHVDYSCRVQTVSEDFNPKFFQLLLDVKEQNGHPLLLNTSFNVRGEPIVNTPEQAYTCFIRSGMDVLVIQNYLYYKDEQDDIVNKLSIDFELD